MDTQRFGMEGSNSRDQKLSTLKRVKLGKGRNTFSKQQKGVEGGDQKESEQSSWVKQES